MPDRRTLNTEWQRAYEDGGAGLTAFFRVHGDDLAQTLTEEGNIEAATEVARTTHQARYDSI